MGIGKSMPYLIFIVYPHIINFFPKPGKWFAYLKYFFAFLLMLTVLWLINILFTSKQNISDNWEEFETYKINEYLDQGYNIFVDVTADWCITCKVNKISVLESRKILDAFSKENFILLQADWTSPNDEIAKFLASNGRFGIRFDIIFSPQLETPIILPEILTTQKLLSSIKKASLSQTK